MARMTKDELKTLVESEVDLAKDVSDLQLEREKAIDYYMGKPFGNEVEGRSKVVSTDVQETIEWIMPSLMRVFASTDRAVVFDPVDPMDEDAAKQESDIVNYTFYKENNGFLNLYTFFKDALMVKNGILKFWWDDDKEEVREEYKGLNEEELFQLLSDENVEPIESEDDGEFFDVVIKRTNSKGRVRIEPIPPEEFLVSSDATSIDLSSARFTCHHTTKTKGELVAMGIKRRLVDSMPTNTILDSPEALARDEINPLESQNVEKIRYDEAYIRVDFDNDGIDELRQVVIAGGKLISNESVDALPFAATTPIILTHKFNGLSVADTVMDLQKIKSALMRGILDNTYLANQPRHAVQNEMVNLDDMLTSRPGGVVRTEAPPQTTIMPLINPPLPQQTFQVLDALENVRKGRTGVGQDTMGLEANALAHGRTGVVNQSFDMARMRIELIARVFAETGLKPLFLGIHRLLLQNQDIQKWMKIRGKWISVDPSEWKTRSNMSVTVGLGTGNRDRQIESLQIILGIQKEMQEKGSKAASDKNVYNALDKLVESMGLRDVDMYFTAPEAQPPKQPPQPSPAEQLQMAQIQADIELKKAQGAAMQNQVVVQNKEAETNRMEAQWKHAEKLKEIETKDLLERTKLELEYQKNVEGAIT